MAEEIHGRFREVRNIILSRIEAFRTGQLVDWDTGVDPRRDISEERIATYQDQLAATEELMLKLGFHSMPKVRCGVASRTAGFI